MIELLFRARKLNINRIKIAFQFNKNVLVVKQNNYATKTVNVYIVYDLDYWPRNPTNNFVLKNWLFGATNIVKTSHKNKYPYSDYGTIFNGIHLFFFISITTISILRLKFLEKLSIL